MASLPSNAVTALLTVHVTVSAKDRSEDCLRSDQQSDGHRAKAVRKAVRVAVWQLWPRICLLCSESAYCTMEGLPKICQLIVKA